MAHNRFGLPLSNKGKVRMNKTLSIVLSILAAAFLLGSFPVRDLLNSTLWSDVCRIIGFVLMGIVGFCRRKRT